MTEGLSIHIGLNAVDSNCYAGWPGSLQYCIADAELMVQLAKDRGFETQLITNDSATRATIEKSVLTAASHLQSGDLFLMSFAGHGSQVRDLDGDEEDGVDETWCLYDGQLLDDEIKSWWPQFVDGVRVLVVSDSCHSGTVTRSDSDAHDDSKEMRATSRFMPKEIAYRTYFERSQFYRNIQRSLPKSISNEHTSVLLLSACQDDQIALEKDGHGVFTAALYAALESGDALHNYKHLFGRISSLIPERQTPNMVESGSSSFVNEPPFNLSGSQR